MGTFTLIELRCDVCNERFEDFFDGAIFTRPQIRAEAHAKGWTRARLNNAFLPDRNALLKDLCPAHARFPKE